MKDPSLQYSSQATHYILVWEAELFSDKWKLLKVRLFITLVHGYFYQNEHGINPLTYLYDAGRL